MKPVDVDIGIAVSLLDDGHVNGGIRRGPRTVNCASGKAVKWCKAAVSCSASCIIGGIESLPMT